MAPRVGEDGSLARRGDNIVDYVDPCIDVHDPFDVATEIVWNERGRAAVDPDGDDEVEDLAEDFARVLAATMGGGLQTPADLPPLFGPPEEFRPFANTQGNSIDEDEEDEDADDEQSNEDDEDDEDLQEDYDAESDCSDEVSEMNAHRLRRMVLQAMMGSDFGDEENDFEFDVMDYEFQDLSSRNMISDYGGVGAAPSDDGEEDYEDEATHSDQDALATRDGNDHEGFAHRPSQGWRGGSVHNSFVGSPARAASASSSDDYREDVSWLCDPLAVPEYNGPVDDLPSSPRFPRCSSRQHQRGSPQSPLMCQRRRRHPSAGPAPESVRISTDRKEIVSEHHSVASGEMAGSTNTGIDGNEYDKTRSEADVAPSLDHCGETESLD